MAIRVRYSQGVWALASLFMAAMLAVWWLCKPELVTEVPYLLRLPFIGLGIWGLGAAFARPLAQDVDLVHLVGVINHPLSHAALCGFVLCTLVIIGWA